uniref:Uncharacterized protein n=1 Tax=Aegilops tauschii subsp. strangulata TaxID=200361 RepID=A0A453L6Q3_AEGTS
VGGAAASGRRDRIHCQTFETAVMLVIISSCEFAAIDLSCVP